MAALLAIAGAEDSLDPVKQLDALMEVGQATRVYVNRGSIANVWAPAPLLGLLDDLVVEVNFPDASFHPKVWAMEFQPIQAGPGKGLRRYRLICASRNLTRFRAWELAASAEGMESAKGGDRMAGEVARFLARLTTTKGARRLAGFPKRFAAARFAALPGSAIGQTFHWHWPERNRQADRGFALPGRARRALIVSPSWT